MRSLKKEYIVVDFSLIGNPRINQEMWVTSTLCQILNFTFVVEEKGFWKALQFVNYLVLQTVSAAPACHLKLPDANYCLDLKKQTLTWNPTEAKTTCLCQYTQGFNLTTISLWNCERYIHSQLIFTRAWHDKNVYNWRCYLLPSKRAILTVVSSYEDLRRGEIESDAVISG